MNKALIVYIDDIMFGVKDGCGICAICLCAFLKKNGNFRYN